MMSRTNSASAGSRLEKDKPTMSKRDENPEDDDDEVVFLFDSRSLPTTESINIISSEMHEKPEKREVLNKCKNSIESLVFPPFLVKGNTKFAPELRSHFDKAQPAYLDQAIKLESKVEVNCNQFKVRARVSRRTWPVQCNYDDEGNSLVTKEGVVLRRRLRAKLLQFGENRRPAYWGTWRKPCLLLGPRRPFGKEPIVNYEVDSDEEWEEEGQPGEILSDSGSDEREPDDADEYEVDYKFTVPDGYLSEDEGEGDNNDGFRLNLKEKNEVEEKMRPMKPSIIGCNWENEEMKADAHHLEVLKQHKGILLTVLAFPIPVLQSDELDGPIGVNEPTGAGKRLVKETDIPILIQHLHGSKCKESTVKDFLNHLERIRPEDKTVPSKCQIRDKIRVIATWNKKSSTWVVLPEILERYDLAGLSPKI